LPFVLLEGSNNIPYSREVDTLTNDGRTSDQPPDAPGPEIFIGLIGAAGTDLYRIRDELKQELRRTNYIPEIVHLSRLMSDLEKYAHLSAQESGPEDERIDSFMDAGDAIRRSVRRGDAVALLGISKIRDIREQHSRDNRPLNRHAYIFHSLKHPEEIRTLRRVYGSAFIAISVYSPRETRKKVLCERIARSRKEYNILKHPLIFSDVISIS
jgi:hypothetical protein